ncbi:hypothetical protein [Paracoccus versutus]|uniref:hypothetical protein n=1 Tax=Paracoccus versutus TaxID=34007 RepID=UPI0011C06ADB|nr:hypothetical protein [Paracoccus versutus]
MWVQVKIIPNQGFRRLCIQPFGRLYDLVMVDRKFDPAPPVLAIPKERSSVATIIDQEPLQRLNWHDAGLNSMCWLFPALENTYQFPARLF